MNVRDYRPTGYEFDLIRALRREQDAAVSKDVLQTALAVRDSTLDKTISNAKQLGYITVTSDEQIKLRVDPVSEMQSNGKY